MNSVKQQRDAVDQALEMLHPKVDDRAALPDLDDLAQRRMAEDILKRFDARQPRPVRPAVWIPAAAALVVAVATAAILYRSRDGQEVDGRRPQQALPTPVARNPVAPLVEPREGPATFPLPGGIAVELGPGTSLGVPLSDPQRHGVTLLRGMALFSVDPQQAPEDFFVNTPKGTIRVTGTLFTVVVSAQEEVIIALHRGNVAWVSAGTETIVAPGEPVRADAAGVAPVDDETIEETIREQIRAVRCSDKRALFTELQGECDSGTAHSLPEEKQKPGGESLGALMAQARRHRADGDFVSAAAAYRQVMRQYPTSNEARTSMISLGQIQLRHLGDPAQAVQQFAAYLQRPGPLAEEALYGQASAYRAMGDRNKEAASLRQLQSTFPSGIYAQAATRRLSVLQEEAP